MRGLAWYSWGSLDAAFFERAASFGTILDGLTEGAPTKASATYNTGDLAVYLRFNGHRGLADPRLRRGRQELRRQALGAVRRRSGRRTLGWGLGVEVGDKKKLVTLGIGYFYLEANFWPAQFTDSDLLDGFTNRKGWAFYVAREILPNTELGVHALRERPDPRPRPPRFDTSVSGADRVRLQTDLLVKF